MAAPKVAIGIDLGTSNSCVGVVRNGRVEIIINELGNRITPSFVAFSNGERFIGDAAKDQALRNPKNTVFCVKRLIGRLYDNPHVQKNISMRPFTLQNDAGNPKIEVMFQGEKKLFSPEEISSMVLIKMKEIAEEAIGTPVTDAVITVPANFNDSQRQATMDAGAIAGLNVLGLLNEPTAAAIAYGVDKKVKDTQNVLVFDLGGGTFDVAILAIRNESFEVLAVSGDAYLGGEDFDERLMDHCIQEFKRKNGVDVSKDASALHSIKKECEKAKIRLSNPQLDHVRVHIFFKGNELHCQISRARFEHLCFDLLNGTLKPLETALQDANLEKNDIDEVVLVGGSTRILKIRELLNEFFHGKNINKTINPDEAVAYGAALHAAILVKDSTVEEIAFTDVTPLSIGIKTLGEEMSTLIHRNSKLPTKNTKQYTTTCHNQTAVDIKVYEGEDSLTVHNHLLGEFTLDGIQEDLKGIPIIEVTFEVDKNGILNVSAMDTSNKSMGGIKITSNKGRLSRKEIEEKVAEAREFRENEAMNKELNEARNQLESFCLEKKEAIDRGLFEGGSQEHSAKIVTACDEVLVWLVDAECLTKEVIFSKKTELENLCSQ